MTFNEKILEGLDEILLAVKSVRQLIQDGGVPENEDWMKAAAPMHQIVNLLTNYRNYKDQEMVEGKNFVVGSDGMLIPISGGQSEELLDKEERELIGYQIDFGEDEWPEGLFSFQVFRTKKDVEDYIFLEDLNEKYYDRIVEIYRGDVEEPSFLGTIIREFGKNEEVMVDDGLHFYSAIVEKDITMEDDDETMPVFPIGPNGKCTSPVDVEVGCVYKKAPGKICPKCGKTLYIEHNEEIDYPFFCPECEENFYEFEVQ